MRVIFLCQEAAFRVGHLAEVILDVFGEVLRRLDLVVRTAEGAAAGLFAAITDGRGDNRSSNSRMWTLLSGERRGAGGLAQGGRRDGALLLLFADGFGF